MEEWQGQIGIYIYLVRISKSALNPTSRWTGREATCASSDPSAFCRPENGPLQVPALRLEGTGTAP